MAKKMLSPEQQKVVCDWYLEGYSGASIAEHLGCSDTPIYSCLRNHGIERRDKNVCKRYYTLDHSYFNIIDREEKAYWLGFIAADGSVQPRRSHVSINLAPKDSDHLEAFKIHIGSDFPLYNYTCNGYSTSRLTFISPELTSALLEFGLDSKKTHSLVWPKLKQNMLRHFLRGYFDGDGTFGTKICEFLKKNGERNREIYFSMLGPERFVTPAQEYLVRKCNVKKTKTYRINPDLTIMRLTYHGNRQVLRIANFMYEDATVYLGRKRDIALNHYRSLPKYRDQLRFG